MKLLFVISRNFWPISGGHEYVLYNYIEKLCKNGHIVDIVSFGEECECPSFINQAFYLKKRGNLSFIFQTIKFFFSKNMSLQSRLYYTKCNDSKINTIIENNNYDTVIYDLVRMSGYAKKNVNYKNVLYSEDLFSKRYSIMLSEKKYANVLGQLGNNKFFKFFSKIPGVLKLILKQETRTILNEEKKASTTFDRIIFVSNVESEEYNKKWNVNNAIDINIGVDIPNINYLNFKHNNDYEMCIIGNFTVAANKDSLIAIIEKILIKFENYRFKVIGKCDKNIIDKYKNDNIVFLGFVDNPLEELCKSNIFLSPIVYGTGIKTKILQALSLGIPTITNNYGVTGLNIDYKNALICENDFDKYHEIINNIVNDYEFRKKLSVNSVKYVENNHNWNNIILKLENVLAK